MITQQLKRPIHCGWDLLDYFPSPPLFLQRSSLGCKDSGVGGNRVVHILISAYVIRFGTSYPWKSPDVRALDAEKSVSREQEPYAYFIPNATNCHMVRFMKQGMRGSIDVSGSS